MRVVWVKKIGIRIGLSSKLDEYIGWILKKCFLGLNVIGNDGNLE